MPPQNGHVKRKFATLFNPTQAMVNGRKFNTCLQNGLWAKAANTPTLLENNLITPNRNLSPFHQCFGKGFGEMSITTYKDNTQQAKLANRGTPGIWVDYAEGHPTSTHQVFNPKTKKVILTKDVIFLQKFYSKNTKVENPVLVTMSCVGSDDDEEFKTSPIAYNNNNVNVVSDSDSNDHIKNNNNIFLMKTLMMKLK